jgi:hypothetical protein
MMKRMLVVLSALVLCGFGGLTTLGLTASDYDGGITFRAVTGANSGLPIFGITPLGRMDLIGGAAFDNYTSSSILSITETTINLVGAVGITSGTITGITDLAVADGGTGSSNASDARTALGLAIGSNVQAYDAELAAVAALTFADDQFILGTGAGTVGMASCTTFAQSILDDANESAFKATVNLEIGSDVQAYDADLVTWAGISPSANVQSFSACADYSAMRTAISLVPGTNVQAYDADLTTYAGITPSANIQSFLGSADYAAARTNLGVTIGSNVQAYDADLTTWATISPSANVQSFSACADYSAMRTAISLVPGTNVQAYSADLATVATAAGTASNEGVLFCTTFKLDYNQTASQTVGIIPANAYVTKVEVAVTTLFNGGGTDVLDVGISGGAADAYVADLDLSAAGYITAGGVFSALGSIGGADRTITCIYADQNADASTGSALVNIYWRAGSIGD